MARGGFAGANTSPYGNGSIDFSQYNVAPAGTDTSGSDMTSQLKALGFTDEQIARILAQANGAAGGTGGTDTAGSGSQSTSADAAAILAKYPNAQQDQYGQWFLPDKGVISATPDAINAHWNDVLKQLQSGTSLADILKSDAATYGGGTPNGGPASVLTPQQYMEMVLGQYAGSPQLGGGDTFTGQNLGGDKGPNEIATYNGPTEYTHVGYDPRAWLNYLISKGPVGYVGLNSGKSDVAEWQRNVAQAMHNVATNSELAPSRGVATSPYGYGYDAKGQQLSLAELTQQAKDLLSGIKYNPATANGQTPPVVSAPNPAYVQKNQQYAQNILGAAGKGALTTSQLNSLQAAVAKTATPSATPASQSFIDANKKYVANLTAAAQKGALTAAQQKSLQTALSKLASAGAL